jgi:hypothetical protein
MKQEAYYEEGDGLGLVMCVPVNNRLSPLAMNP